jgi:membrane protein
MQTPVKTQESETPGNADRQQDRGRHADKPSDLPKRGWKDVLWRTKQQIDEDNLSIIAAGVSFYGFVAVVPALAAGIAIYALVADASQIGKHLDLISRVVPGEAMPLLTDQINRIVSDNHAAGWGALLGILLAIYSSSNATKAIITGLNVAYDEEEHRGFFKLNAMALALTLAAIVGALLVLALVAILPAALGYIGLTSGAEALVSWLRWPLLVVLFMTGLAVVYRFAPSRQKPRWRWVSWGAALSTFLWIVGSAAFSFYVTRFGGYQKTYGSLGAVVVFLFWLYLSAYVVLLGAELNSEMERQTVKDTTDGPPKDMGERGAYAADTVGPAKQ